MNKYEKLDIAGEGAYGVVLKCKHKETGEVVAIKKFKEQPEEDEASRKVTLREAKLLKALKHENIVDLKEAFRRKGTLYLVFEFMETSVIDMLDANPSGLDAEVVRKLIYQLLRALEHCHRHNVVHRDIKPENLLVNPGDYSMRLCDFGCARQIKPDVPLTDYVATRWYRPPELLLGSKAYGKGVDIWSTGCIMGELMDGKPLFPGKSEIDQLHVIQNMMGNLSSQQVQLKMENSNFKGIELAEYANPTTLHKRYASCMSETQLQLLCGCIVMDEAKRLSAKAATRSKWFEGIKLPPSLRPPEQASPAKASPSKATPASSSKATPASNSAAAPQAEALHEDGLSSMMPKSTHGCDTFPNIGKSGASGSHAALPAIGAPGQSSAAAVAASFAVRTTTDDLEDKTPSPLLMPIQPFPTGGSPRQALALGASPRHSEQQKVTPRLRRPSADSPRPEALMSHQSTLSNPYVLPWETSKVPEELALEYTRTPTPFEPFGSGTLSGTFSRLARESGGDKGGSKGPRAALGSVARWQTIGMRESRWSGF